MRKILVDMAVAVAAVVVADDVHKMNLVVVVELFDIDWVEFENVENVAHVQARIQAFW